MIYELSHLLNDIQALKEADKAYHAAMYKENSFEEAIAHLTTLLEKSPWNIEYLEARASCYEHRGKFADAILDLRYLPFYFYF